MESQTVMLPDGSTETVLVPKVYLAHVNARALQPGGALVTGNGVTINTTESIVNSGGVIDGGNGRTLLVAGQDIVNRGGTIAGAAVALGADGDIRNETLAVKQSYASNHNSGSYTSLSNQATVVTTGTLDIQAGRDLVDLGGSIKAGSATITAGRDISFNTVQTGSTYQHLVSGYTQNDSSVTHALSQISTTGDLTIATGRDLLLSGTQATIGGSGTVLAGRALTVASVTNEVKTAQQNDPASKTYDKRVHENQTVVGAGIGAGGDLKLRAGISEIASLTMSASGVAAGGAVSIGASGDVNIEGAQEKHLLDVASRRESSSALKKSSSSASDYLASTTVVGSSVTGGSVAISAGNDVKINGSEVLADKALTLAAGRDLLVGRYCNADRSPFSEHSHGLRPGRRTRDAMLSAQPYVREGYRTVVDVDLSKFFDRVNHDILIDPLWKSVNNTGIIPLVRAYLNAGIMEGGVAVERSGGRPHGGPLLPLLADVLLDEVDRMLERPGHCFARLSSTTRTSRCRPACRVVWEGTAQTCGRPYPDFEW